MDVCKLLAQRLCSANASCYHGSCIEQEYKFPRDEGSSVSYCPPGSQWRINKLIETLVNSSQEIKPHFKFTWYL